MRRILVSLVIGSLIIFAATVHAYLRSEPGTIQTLVGEPYRELIGAAGYIHTGGAPVTIGESLKHGIVLIEFMRYGCVNCQRSFPHLVRLKETYPEGLTIIGIHTPQFAYEGEEGNVTKAMEAAHITFPIVLDNTYATWNLYGNKFWPRTLIIDRSGTIVYDAVGTLKHEEVETVLKGLLEE